MCETNNMIQIDWDLDSGNLVLDFANTAEFHASEQPDERLNSYADLVSWAAAAGIISRQVVKALLSSSKENPKRAKKALQDALELREIIYSIFSALADDNPPRQKDLAEFNKFLSRSLNHARVMDAEETYTWGWDNMEASLDSLVWPVARETANLLTSPDMKRVGECADDRGCGFLFIDTSRNHSRRWCSMESCGNRAKAQRHYQKASKKSASPKLDS
jgi:predicted RNA-binding Zn ribbon-like protein